MSLEKGDIVYSTAGRDTGLYAVLCEKDGYVYIANGAQRRIQHPKRKNPKHLIQCIGHIREEDLAFDKWLKRAISALGGEGSVRRVEACLKKML